MARLKTWFGVFVVVAAIFLGIKLLPPYFANYQLQDDIESIARYATYAQGKGAEDVRSDVMAKARERGVALNLEDVNVTKDGVSVSIDIKYVVEVPVPGYTFKLKFNPTAGNRMITAK